MVNSDLKANNYGFANGENVEKLENVYTLNDDAVELLDNGWTFQTAKPCFFHCAIGSNSYSSDAHTIPLKVHKGHAFFGIRSRSIKPVLEYASNIPMYIKNPSKYGWVTNDGRVMNGDFDSHKLEWFYRENATFESMLNCNERRLRHIPSSKKRFFYKIFRFINLLSFGQSDFGAIKHIILRAIQK